MPLAVSPFRKGSLDSQEFSLYDLRGGLNVRQYKSPQLLADNDLIQAYNGYLTAGGFSMRNGMSVYQAAVTSGSHPVLGLARFFQQVNNGATVSPVVPVTLAQVQGELYNANAPSDIGSIGGSTAFPMTWVRCQDAQHVLPVPAAPILTAVGGTSTGYTGYVVLTYLNALGETTVGAQSSQTVDSSHQIHVASPAAQANATTYNVYAGTMNGSGWKLQNSSPIAIGTPFTIPGTLLAVTAPPSTNTATALTDVIVICTGVGGPYIYDGVSIYTPSGWAAASGARWCAMVNGILWFGGIGSTPRTIYGTGDGINTSFETLPATNLFVMSNPVTGLCALGTGAIAALAIGQNGGLSVLFGTGALNYSLQDVPFFYDGPVSGYAMVYDAGVLYFLGQEAVYAFDGAQVISISNKIEPWLLNDPFAPGFPLNGDRTKAFSFIFNARLHVAYINGNGSVPNTIAVYDFKPQAWTVLQTTPGISCATALDAPNDPTPTTFIVGSTLLPKVYNWDVAPAIGSAATDAGTAITATVQTKFFKIGAPGTAKLLTRLYPEFFLNGPLTAAVSVTLDYGGSTSSQSLNDAGVTQHSLIAPTSRLDWAAQGEAFSFTVQTTGASSPWTLNGATGLFHQRGMT